MSITHKGRCLNQLSYSHPVDYHVVVKSNGSLFEREEMTVTIHQTEKNVGPKVCTT